MRVGLLGGSFDPVHYGHLRAAQWALAAFELDAVRLVPAKQSPFKGPCVASVEDRKTMLTLATQDNASLVVEDCELNRPAPSYTVDTLRTLLTRAPASRFVLILGSDAAAGLEKWEESAEVRRLCEIQVLRRPVDQADRGSASAVLPFEGLAVSSTQLRGAIARGQSIRYLTPEPVRLYIEEKGLYK